MNNGRQRILLFGGTFDPPHRAHVDLPVRVAEHLGCERILYVPAATSPLKTDTPPTEKRHRLAMLRLAIRYLPNAEIATTELDRGGMSFFIDTVRALRERFADDTKLYFLIGCDQVVEFDKWKEAPGILALADPVVLLRPPWNEHSFRDAMFKQYSTEEAARWLGCIVPAPMLEISSTEIRRRLRAGEDVNDHLDVEVAGYVAREGLYG